MSMLFALFLLFPALLIPGMMLLARFEHSFVEKRADERPASVASVEW